MLTYQVENFDDVSAELALLFPDHWAENANFRNKVPLDPNWALYSIMQGKGLLNVFTGRYQGALVAYYVSNIVQHPHYQTLLCSFVDLFYIVPEYRQGMNGLKLFMAYEVAMRDLMTAAGKDKMLLVGRSRLPQMMEKHQKLLEWFGVGRLLKYLGWTPVEICWVKLLEHTNG